MDPTSKNQVLIKRTEEAINLFLKDDPTINLPIIRNLEEISYRLFVESNDVFLEEDIDISEDDRQTLLWDDDYMFESGFGCRHDNSFEGEEEWHVTSTDSASFYSARDISLLSVDNSCVYSDVKSSAIGFPDISFATLLRCDMVQSDDSSECGSADMVQSDDSSECGSAGTSYSDSMIPDFRVCSIDMIHGQTYHETDSLLQSTKSLCSPSADDWMLISEAVEPIDFPGSDWMIISVTQPTHTSSVKEQASFQCYSLEVDSATGSGKIQKSSLLDCASDVSMEADEDANFQCYSLSDNMSAGIGRIHNSSLVDFTSGVSNCDCSPQRGRDIRSRSGFCSPATGLLSVKECPLDDEWMLVCILDDADDSMVSHSLPLYATVT